MKKRTRKKPRRAQLTKLYQRDALQNQLWEAAAHLRAGQLGECERAARKALRIDSGNLDATVLLCQVFEWTGRSLEALAYLREAVHQHPKNSSLYLHIASLALDAGRLQEARRAHRKFRDRQGSDPFLKGRRSKMLQEARRLGREIERRIAAEERTKAPASRPRDRATPGSSRQEQPSLFDEPGAPGKGRERPGAHPVTETPSALAAGSPESHPSRTPIPSGAAAVPGPGRCSPAVPEPALPNVAVRLVEIPDGSAAGALPAWMDDPWNDDLAERDLLLESQRIALRESFDELLCLPTLAGVTRLDYQIETARKILRSLRGRALLCDEVGLGKTIEAGMVIKEYLLRGMARRVLILVPAGLVGQWGDEMSTKFGLEFEVWKGGEDERAAPDGKPLLVLGSIARARLERNLAAFTGLEWDLVVVDEAHHLRRRGTRSWALVNSLRKRFLLLLSATPVHNHLKELYELVTLVRPGLLGSPGEFRRRFMADKEGRRARDPDRLREILGEVMVRNTRSHADVALPRRFASTLVVEPHPAEAAAYRAASAFAGLAYPGATPQLRMALRHLLASAGSGPRALAEVAGRWIRDRRPLPAPAGASAGGAAAPLPAVAQEARSLLASAAEEAASAGRSAKVDRLLELLAASEEQVLVFCRYRATLDNLARTLTAAGIAHAIYHGGLTPRGKDRVIARFQEGARVLLSTESGGEGRNIQFCRTVVNYDLPWDPMRIEQRIGRVHRIGQTRDVFVFNLVLAGTAEEEMLRLLEEKIHLFELIVGEVDSILGNLDRREEFGAIVLDLWAGSRNDAERRLRFEEFGGELAAARAAYEQDRALGDELFADELEA